MRVVLLLVALAGLAAGQPAQPTGSISGRVTVRHSGAPVRGAVVLSVRGVQESGTTWTGPDGRFTIDGLAPGGHHIVVIKPALDNSGRSTRVKAGEETRNVDMTVSPRGVFAGEVRDREDLPVQGAIVSLHFPSWLYGRPQMFPSRAAATDDRGEFRISPHPSSYFVVLQPPSRPGLAGHYRLLHPPLFYPNALNPALARSISPAPGVQSLDFEVPEPADTVLRIATRAAKANEAPRTCRSCVFRIAARNGPTWLEVLNGTADNRGRIEIRGLHPGSYRIAIGRAFGSDVYAGYTDATVEEGQLRAETATAWAAKPIPVRLILVDPPEELRSAGRTWTARLEAAVVEPLYPPFAYNSGASINGKESTGRGLLPLPPGEWALHLGGPDVQQGMAYIERVLLAGEPQRGPLVRVSQQGATPPIEIRVGFATGALTGTVSGMPSFEPGLHQTGGFIQAIPDPADGYNSRLEGVMRSNGSFEISPAPPGDYILFAVGPRAPGEPRPDFADPAVRSRYASHAKRVTLAPGETLSVELEAIP